MKNHFINEQKKTFIPELSLVAVLEDNIIVGEIALHETDIATENGRITQLVLFQSAVLPKYRTHGIAITELFWRTPGYASKLKAYPGIGKKIYI